MHVCKHYEKTGCMFAICHPCYDHIFEEFEKAKAKTCSREGSESDGTNRPDIEHQESRGAMAELSAAVLEHNIDNEGRKVDIEERQTTREGSKSDGTNRPDREHQASLRATAELSAAVLEHHIDNEGPKVDIEERQTTSAVV